MSARASTPPQAEPFASARPASSALSNKTTNLRATQRHLVTIPEQRDRALLVRTDAKNAGQVLKIDGGMTIRAM